MFSRLGRTDEEEDAPRAAKAAGLNIDVGEEDDSDGEGSVLQYAGVLKKSSLSQKKEPIQKPAPTTLRRLGVKFKPSSDSPTSSSSDGVPPGKLSVLQRLGKLPAAHSSSAASPPPADTQDNRVTSTRPRARARPAVASSKVSSSTGTAGGAECLGAQMDVGSVSVFKRLGSKRT